MAHFLNRSDTSRSMSSRRLSPLQKQSSAQKETEETQEPASQPGAKIPARNDYILQVTSGGTSLLQITRPPALVELEELLAKASDLVARHSTDVSWIKAKKRSSLQASYLKKIGARSKSAQQFIRKEETKVRTSQRLNPLRPAVAKKEKVQYHDDLELLKPTAVSRAPLQPGKRMGSLKQSVNLSSEEILAKADQLQRVQREESQDEQKDQDHDNSDLGVQLRAWVTGERRSVAGEAMEDARASIWKSELHRAGELRRSAAKIQRKWRTHRQHTRFQRYTVGREKRAKVAVQEVFALWVRVHYQRPLGRGGRGLLSFWTISWRVEVRKMQIAREKAKDLRSLWRAVHCKRVLKSWLKVARALQMQHSGRARTGLRYWKDYCSDERVWKDSQAGVRHRFKLHAYGSSSAVHAQGAPLSHALALRCRFRALFFYGRCRAKCRQRSYRLFRLEEQSVHPMVMPLERFRGDGSLFNCEELLESFRDKDAEERKVQRMCYIRLAPRVIENWRLAIDDRKMRRYAIRRREETLLYKDGAHSLVRIQCLHGLRELTALDENGERLHAAASDSEADEAVPAAGADMVKQLETDIDHLSGLVDHEHRENLRQKVKEEKRKMMVRIKFDALSKERDVVGKMPAEYTASNAKLEEEIAQRESRHTQKRSEESRLLERVSLSEAERWSASLDRVRHLWSAAVDILAKVYDDAQAQHQMEVFVSCWMQIRKPAFHVRLRRIFSRNHIRRLVIICAHHSRMERSIYKFRPLRRMFSSWQKWMRAMEESYKLTTPGLKVRVRRRYELRQVVSEQLELEYAQRPLGAPHMTQHEMFSNPALVLAAWMEHTANVRAYSAVAALLAARARARLLARAFEFLWLGKARRTGDLEQEDEEAEPCFAAANASADLAVWRKGFFTGVRYTTILQKAAELRKRLALKIVNRSVRLAPLLWERRQSVEARLEHEKRLLIRHFDGSETRQTGKVGERGMGMTLTGSYPAKHWSTVLNLRRSEVLVLLESCDNLAQHIHRTFDSVTVAFGLSLWLFRIRCNHLPQVTDKALASDKLYWRHIKDLFQHARTGHLVGK